MPVKSIFKIRAEKLITYLAMGVGNCGGLFKSDNKCCDPILLKCTELHPITHETIKEKVKSTLWLILEFMIV